MRAYPIASTCSPASLESVSRIEDLFVERMAKSKAQEEDGSWENEQLDTGEFEKPELTSSTIEDDDEKLPPFLSKQKSKLGGRAMQAIEGVRLDSPSGPDE